MIKIKSLHIYPIKSIGSIDLKESQVTHRGLTYDRRWVLVDEQNRFVSQRENPHLALLQPELHEHQMKVVDRSQHQSPILFDLTEPDTEADEVTIWDDVVPAKPVSSKVNEWFSNFMRAPVRLMYMHEESVRQADQRYAITPANKVSFADGYPILIVSEASMNLLNTKLISPLKVNRFRANIIVEGTEPHEEDSWREVRTAQQTLFGVKPCARCVMTTIDPETAVAGKEPLKTLSSYRQIGNKILFGENFIPKEEGVLKVGDEVTVVQRKEAAIS